jgi:hypothetical protein
MMGRGDGNGINRFVIEELANILICFGLTTQLLHSGETLAHYVVIDVTKRCDFYIRKHPIGLNVIFTPAAQTNDGDTHPTVGTQNLSLIAPRAKAAASRCDSDRFRSRL